MIIVLAIAFLLFPISAFGQHAAVTDTGKEVYLYSDGMWEYINEQDNLNGEILFQYSGNYYSDDSGTIQHIVYTGLVAAELSPFRPELASSKAGRLMPSEIARYVGSGVSFGLETTLAGRSYA